MCWSALLSTYRSSQKFREFAPVADVPVPFRDRRGGRRYEDGGLRDRLRPVLARLEEFGWIKRVYAAGGRGRPPETYLVNPYLHSAEAAASEGHAEAGNGGGRDPIHDDHVEEEDDADSVTMSPGGWRFRVRASIGSGPDLVTKDSRW